MANACHTEEIIKFQYFVSLEVLLELRVHDISGLAIGPKELSIEFSLHDFLIKGIAKAIIQFADLLELPSAFVIKLSVSHFSSADLAGNCMLKLIKCLTAKVS